MQATYVQEGDAVDYTPGADVAAGDVIVQGDLVGVAPRLIKANALGALAVTGVYDFTKSTAGGSAIGAGVLVYWDDTANQATATAIGNKLIGKSIKAAADGDATVRIRMNQ